MQSICILGSTGSIGQSTIDVVLRHPDKYQVFALTANKNIRLLVQQAALCNPQYIALADEKYFAATQELIKQHGLACEVLCGERAILELAAHNEVDVVMAAIVGAAGLLPTMAGVNAGKKVLLANKEALVMSGDLFIQAANRSKAQLLPIDSEHNAIFQCLPRDFVYGDLAASGMSKILLTGSGGPFLNTPIEQLCSMTPQQACAHPNWDMGRKISVDSATMMNKGLEFIEARWLFGLQSDDIEVVLHPQSIIHSMVQYCDGSVLAQMGNPDMRTPIAHALAYPKRIESGVAPLNFMQLANFSFCAPDFARYPNLKLAIDASNAGQSATTVLNAANESAVEAFLQEQIGFTQIARVNDACLQAIPRQDVTDINSIIAIDNLARRHAATVIAQIAGNSQKVSASHA
ncbi:MAG: 1-deoxy-D-xylulose-5-phosphate reductoisomerase [Paraglaciecola sp.]|uniref:1-deoxy-D-xylulose-5-phosphate reductoisomerase n=1 Tax=Paraglaciecola sp. TaxID=1920173 RepID=UPI00273FD99B|nr:1-deoxy-D-xylulose-5-phosphate reductoisomerase [Paraglaciecola sp.]MDP5029490.1 1-deoxy-D-xylulose-5-phosphate reductoisomerase [Paraglaciecola sp.]MDP5129297.1 1-deoxy-D-xylulose-5-phosphate reductoisomerase [Paraglaciecola sp.]